MDIPTKEDFREFRDQILEEVKLTIRHELSGLSVSNNDASDEYLNTKDAAKLLLVSERQMRNYKASKVIPYHKVGGRLMFKKEDLLAFVEAHRISSRYGEQHLK